MNFRQRLLQSWQRPNFLTLLLWPLSGLYGIVFWLRGWAYSSGLLASYRAKVPIVIVGNLTVGGTGKTPLVIYLIEQLRERGFNPGVISRGYHSSMGEFPAEVTQTSSVAEVGDEPMMIVNRTGVPMVVGPNRAAAIERLLASHKVDLIISDDGLQHLALQRDIEICLVDHTSLQANPHLLPAGPYRESRSRLNTVDYVVNHGGDVDGGFGMQLEAQAPKPLLNDNHTPFDSAAQLHAIAGIGNPQRFFDTCAKLGFDIAKYEFPDHHQFTSSEITFADELQVLMTEKDAVKCKSFATEKHWYLPVDAKISGGLIDKLDARLRLL